ncbi:hypothetical protein ABTK37_20080, partial [Acinetobacter baumannii]
MPRCWRCWPSAEGHRCALLLTRPGSPGPEDASTLHLETDMPTAAELQQALIRNFHDVPRERF